MERLGKLERFESTVMEEVAVRCEEIAQELESYRSQELKQAESVVLEESYQYIRRQVAEIESKTTKEVSRMRLEMKKRLYERREDYRHQLFEQASEHLRAFASSPEYRTFLLEKARVLGEAFVADGTLLLVRDEDLPLAEELRQAYGFACEVRASAQIRLGGVIAENEGKGCVADESLDAILAAQREWLCEQKDFVVAM